MFLDDETPARNRPWSAILPLVAGGTWQCALGVSHLLNDGAPATLYLSLLYGVLGLGQFMVCLSPLRSEAALSMILVANLFLPWIEQPRIPVLGSNLLAGATALWLLLRSWNGARHRAESRRRPLVDLLGSVRTQHGEDLLSLSRQSPILLICLRHFGCVFCREALATLALQEPAIQGVGTRIVLVHQSPEEEARQFFQTFGLEHLPRVSDPARWLYFHLGLRQGSPWQLLGPKVWWRALSAGLFRRHGLGKVMGNARQMPGVFLIRDGVILASFLHRTAADNPDFQALAQCPS